MDVTKLTSAATRLGLLPEEAAAALAMIGREPTVSAALAALLDDPTGRPRALALSLLSVGDDTLAAEIAAGLAAGTDEVAGALEASLHQAAQDVLLTGAEAVTVMLAEAGATTVFTYAGTSELSVCDAVARMPGVELVNGRGDKEAALMAAGASLLTPNHGAAVLHGARGLTNAVGAVADARRNEAGTVFVVGLPTTESAPFLPPHAEPDLLATVGRFATSWWEAPPVPTDEAERLAAACKFVAAFRSVAERARQKPYGPTLFGLPQDVAETAWIPWQVVTGAKRLEARPVVPQEHIDAAVRLMQQATRPLILVDDYLIRPGGAAQSALADVADRIGAPVLQVRYRRGAMLFERLSMRQVSSFIGWLDPNGAHHRRLLAGADLLITVEDRNMYPRVIGDLPSCTKVAITSDAAKVRKNGYLGAGDLLVEDDPVMTLHRLGEALALAGHPAPGAPWAGQVNGMRTAPMEPAVGLLRSGIVVAIAEAMAAVPEPVVVDDSQMFGGLVSEYYDVLPDGARVFGGHGGFVGAGISYATGLAVARGGGPVFCFLGDQAFTNNLQGLAVAGELAPRIVYLVCNNGESVSLLKQATTRPGWDESGRTYLGNARRLSYTRVAEGFGVTAATVDLRVMQTVEAVQDALRLFQQRLAEAVDHDGPTLIEMRLPSLGDFWEGIWTVKGFE